MISRRPHRAITLASQVHRERLSPNGDLVMRNYRLFLGCFMCRPMRFAPAPRPSVLAVCSCACRSSAHVTTHWRFFFATLYIIARCALGCSASSRWFSAGRRVPENSRPPKARHLQSRPLNTAPTDGRQTNEPSSITSPKAASSCPMRCSPTSSASKQESPS